jgi:hypothetical protein
MLAEELRAELGVAVAVSDVVTDAWTVHAPSSVPAMLAETEGAQP